MVSARRRTRPTFRPASHGEGKRRRLWPQRAALRQWQAPSPVPAALTAPTEASPHTRICQLQATYIDNHDEIWPEVCQTHTQKERYV